MMSHCVRGTALIAAGDVFYELDAVPARDPRIKGVTPGAWQIKKTQTMIKVQCKREKMTGVLRKWNIIHGWKVRKVGFTVDAI